SHGHGRSEKFIRCIDGLSAFTQRKRSEEDQNFSANSGEGTTKFIWPPWSNSNAAGQPPMIASWIMVSARFQSPSLLCVRYSPASVAEAHFLSKAALVLSGSSATARGSSAVGLGQARRS